VVKITKEVSVPSVRARSEPIRVVRRFLVELSEYPHLFGAKEKTWCLLAGALGLCLVTLADVVTGEKLAFSIFYLVPVGFVAWFVGRPAGLGFSLVGAGAWFLADWITGQRYTHSLILVWDAAVRLGFFYRRLAPFNPFRHSLRGTPAGANGFFNRRLGAASLL